MAPDLSRPSSGAFSAVERLLHIGAGQHGARPTARWRLQLLPGPSFFIDSIPGALPMEQSQKRASKARIPIDRLVRYAQATRLPSAKRVPLVRLFETGTAPAAELAARRDEVPAATVADPFVSALRRLCWPSRRLPERHWKAISAVGLEPLAFARLALEEARTRAWREHDAEPLAKMVRWLEPLFLRESANPSEMGLGVRGLAYLALCQNGIAPGPATPSQVRASRRLSDISEKYLRHLESSVADTQLAGETAMAFALTYAKCFERAEAAEMLAVAEKIMRQASREERALFGLVRAWVAEHGMDADQADARLHEAFRELDERSDPWLAFFLHQNGARLAINRSLGFRPDNGDLLKKSADHGSSEGARLLWVMSHHVEVPEAAADALLRARIHLEAAAPLLEEFGSHELRLLQHWYWGHALVLDDPARGLDHIYDAMDLAYDKNQLSRILQMAADSLFLKSRLRLLGILPERSAALQGRGSRMRALMEQE